LHDRRHGGDVLLGRDGEERTGDRRGDEAGEDGVDGYTGGGERRGEGAGERHEGGFRGGVDWVEGEGVEAGFGGGEDDVAGRFGVVGVVVGEEEGGEQLDAVESAEEVDGDRGKEGLLWGVRGGGGGG
jgi:hypothetical protein